MFVILTTADLAGQTICLIIGSPAQMALEQAFGHATPPIVRLSFREDVEMLDAYPVGRCDAAVDDTSRLRQMMQTRGINNLRSRLLSPPLEQTGLYALTPVADPKWAAIVDGALDAMRLNTAVARP